MEADSFCGECGTRLLSVYSQRAPIPPKLRFTIFNRDGFACRYCGRQAPDVKLHVDHIVPVARGGNNDPDNLITACADCNLGKGVSVPDLADLDTTELLAEEWLRLFEQLWDERNSLDERHYEEDAELSERHRIEGDRLLERLEIEDRFADQSGEYHSNQLKSIKRSELAFSKMRWRHDDAADALNKRQVRERRDLAARQIAVLEQFGSRRAVQADAWLAEDVVQAIEGIQLWNEDETAIARLNQEMQDILDDPNADHDLRRMAESHFELERQMEELHYETSKESRLLGGNEPLDGAMREEDRRKPTEWHRP